MGESPPSAALNVLAEAYRERRTGVLSLGTGEEHVQLALRDGHVVGIVIAPEADWRSESLRATPDDSARMKLDRVLAEVGLAPRKAERKAKASAPADDLRERVLGLLVDMSAPAELDEVAELPGDVASVAGATEPLMLEAVRRLKGAEPVRELLGDLDRRLVATDALATEERTLTLTEGYILSRIDGQCTVRQVLQLVPLDPDETERSLLGLLLAGRVRAEAVPERSGHPRPEKPQAPEAPAATDEQSEHIPLELPLTEGLEEGAGEAPAAEAAAPADAAEGGRAEEEADLDPELLARRREILEVFQALPLRNHFEVLGLEPGCSDADVRRAHVAHVKRYHPDMQRDPRLTDLHDVLEAIFIRVGEAWEVLGSTKSRAAYEARLGVAPRVVATPGPSSEGRPPAAAASPDAEAEALAKLPPEETLMFAKRLIREERYWEAIRLLETAMPRLQPRRQEHRGRILLARAYAQNPNWVRKAEETLQNVVREDPANADAHYELGMLYKARGATTRAQAMFKKVVELKPDHKRAIAEIGGPAPAPGGILSRLFKRGG